MLHVLVTLPRTHLAAVLGAFVAAREFVLARSFATKLFFGHVTRHLLRVTTLSQLARNRHVARATLLQHVG